MEKVEIPLRLRDFQAQWESSAFGLFHGAAFSTALLPINCAIDPKIVQMEARMAKHNPSVNIAGILRYDESSKALPEFVIGPRAPINVFRASFWQHIRSATTPRSLSDGCRPAPVGHYGSAKGGP